MPAREVFLFQLGLAFFNSSTILENLGTHLEMLRLVKGHTCRAYGANGEFQVEIYGFGIHLEPGAKFQSLEAGLDYAETMIKKGHLNTFCHLRPTKDVQ